MITLLCIALLGDSITSRQGSWAYESYLRTEMSIVAEGGATVRALHAQIDRVRCSDGEDPEIVHVMVGGNDAGPIHLTDPIEWELHLVIALDEIRRRWPNTALWISYAPRLYNRWFVMDNVRALATYDSIVLKQIKRYRAVLGIDGRTLDLPPSHFSDGVHPNVAGNEIIRQAFKKRIWVYRNRGL